MDRGHDGRPGGEDSIGDGDLARGQTLGRYLIIALIGKGAMGDVYAAYDPELDRKVALKLLRARSGLGTDASEGRTRLLREAQAIARLSDPNVVAVFDVGALGDRVFLAMEFVDGITLGPWLNARPRPWREIVATFMAAGRGLASAHRAGVVHRDFKPENVMITADGKVRVMDFGLARAIDRSIGPAIDPATGPATGPATESGSPPAEIPRSGVEAWPVDVGVDSAGVAPDPLLSISGAMVGTPAYMAPEQFRGERIDARADQFSFCVALYEGLYGERPFRGESLRELTANVVGGVMRDAPSRSRAPRWLRRVVLRGLRVAPEQRYPSMDDLITALAQDPARWRIQWAAALVVLTLIVALGAGLLRAQRQQRRTCLGGEAKLAGVWELPVPGQSSPGKELIRRAFLQTHKPYAAESFSTVMRALDRYVVSWSVMYRESCEATNIRGDQSPEVLDLRTACLGDRLSEVRALANILRNADGETVTNAVQAVQAIRPVEPCADIPSLRAVVRPPKDAASRLAVSQVRAELANLKALMSAGQYQQAQVEIVGVVDRARRTRYEPLVAEALLRLGNLEANSSDEAAAEKSYEDAVWLAEASRHDEVVVEAETDLVYEVGSRQGRFGEAERWASHAEAILARLGPGHDLMAGWLANNRGANYEQQGRLTEALTIHLEALRLKQAALGPRQLDVALSEGNIATVLLELGRTAEAEARNDLALKIVAETVGLEHPSAVPPLITGADLMTARGDYMGGRNLAHQALEIFERDLEPDHAFLAYPLTTIGSSYVQGGQSPLAISYLERALRIRERRKVAPDLLAETRFALALALWESGVDPARGLALAKQAREDYQSSPYRKQKAAEIDRWIEHRTAGKKTP